MNAKLSEVFHKHGLFCKDIHAGRDRNGLKRKTRHRNKSHSLKRPDFSLLLRDLDTTANDQSQPERPLGDILLFGNIKCNYGEDPCHKITSDEDLARLPPHARQVDKDDDASFLVQGQLINYAHAIYTNSHRTHLLAFIILPTHARLLRFDGAGVVFSELFEWRSTHYIAHLLQRVAAASNAERGIDTSVGEILASDGLVARAKGIFTEAEQAETLPDTVTWESIFGADASHEAAYSLFDVYDDVSNSFHRVLTCRAHMASPQFDGRATRGYIGIDLDASSVVYMKRSWRIDDRDTVKERDIYRKFEEAGVRHLPGCYFGGDVPLNSGVLAAEFYELKESKETVAEWTPSSSIKPIRTRSGDYTRDYGVHHGATSRTNHTNTDREVQRHVLHVTLFSKIGSKLSQFSRSYDLCTVIRDAIESVFGLSIYRSHLVLKPCFFH